jgi:hypothetical protein
MFSKLVGGKPILQMQCYEDTQLKNKADITAKLPEPLQQHCPHMLFLRGFDNWMRTPQELTSACILLRFSEAYLAAILQAVICVGPRSAPPYFSLWAPC